VSVIGLPPPTDVSAAVVEFVVAIHDAVVETREPVDGGTETTELNVPAGSENAVMEPTTDAVALTADGNVNVVVPVTTMVAVTLKPVGVAPAIVMLDPVTRLCAAVVVTPAVVPLPEMDEIAIDEGTADENVNVNAV
jgi:hypothetical protein